jgi:hypothetical protein
VKAVWNIEWSCNGLCIFHCLHFVENVLVLKCVSRQSYVELHGRDGILIFSRAAAWDLPAYSVR